MALIETHFYTKLGKPIFYLLLVPLAGLALVAAADAGIGRIGLIIGQFIAVAVAYSGSHLLDRLIARRRLQRSRPTVQQSTVPTPSAMLGPSGLNGSWRRGFQWSKEMTDVIDHTAKVIRQNIERDAWDNAVFEAAKSMVGTYNEHIPKWIAASGLTESQFRQYTGLQFSPIEEVYEAAFQTACIRAVAGELFHPAD